MKRSISIALAAVAALLVVAPAASAATDPFGRTCVPQAERPLLRGAHGDARADFDGVPLDVDVTLPADRRGAVPDARDAARLGRQQVRLRDERDPTGGERPLLQRLVRQAGLRGRQLLRARVRRLVRRVGVAGTIPAARRAGSTSATSATRRATPSTCSACSSTRASRSPTRSAVTGVSYGGGQSHDARLPERPHADARRLVRAVAQPERHAAASSPPRGRAGRGRASCPRSPRTAASSTSARPRRGRAAHAARHPQDRATSAACTRPARRPASTRPPGVDPNADLTTWFAEIATAASRRRATSARSSTEISNFHSGFGLGSRVRRRRAAADPERLDRRPVPRPRGVCAPTTTCGRAIRTRHVVAPARRPRPRARAEQAGGRRGAERRGHRVPRPARAPERQRPCAPGSVVAYTQTCPKAAPARRAVPRVELGARSTRAPCAQSFVARADRAAPTAATRRSARRSTRSRGGGDRAAGRRPRRDRDRGLPPAVNERVHDDRPADGRARGSRPTARRPARRAPVGHRARTASRSSSRAAGYRLADNQSGEITFQLHRQRLPVRARATPPSSSCSAATRRTCAPSNGRSRVEVSDLTLELPVRERAAAARSPGTRGAHLLLRVKPRRPRAGRMTRFRVTVYASTASAASRPGARRARVASAASAS